MNLLKKYNLLKYENIKRVTTSKQLTAGYNDKCINVQKC